MVLTHQCSVCVILSFSYVCVIGLQPNLPRVPVMARVYSRVDLLQLVDSNYEHHIFPSELRGCLGALLKMNLALQGSDWLVFSLRQTSNAPH